jgi:GNAT superfamily N-acetyltransferase
MPHAHARTDLGVPIRVRLLADSPEVIPTLASWFREEWHPWYGPGGPGNAEADLRSCCNRDVVPIALVAFGSDDTVLGTAALKAESVGSDVAPGPWLAAFLVGRAYRREGVGATLINAIEALANGLGFATLYASTNTANELFERCGWSVLDEASSTRGPVKVYSKRV